MYIYIYYIHALNYVYTLFMMPRLFVTCSSVSKLFLHHMFILCVKKTMSLGTNKNANYLLTADSTATYVCVSRGGANPSAQNKTTVSGPVSATSTFSSGKNGQVTAS